MYVLKTGREGREVRRKRGAGEKVENREEKKKRGGREKEVGKQCNKLRGAGLNLVDTHTIHTDRYCG